MAARLLWTGGHAQAGWQCSSSTVHDMHGGNSTWERMLPVQLGSFKVAKIKLDVLKVTTGKKVLFTKMSKVYF